MKLDAHGGDLLAMASVSKRDPASLLDFSVNVRPEGAPEFLRAALVRAIRPRAYPSPNARGLCRCGTPIRPARGRFAFGNGSNELIHALARVLKGAAHPAFPSSNRRSANTLACRLADGKQPALGRHRFRCGRQPSGDLLAGLPKRPGWRVSGQPATFGAVPHARRMPVPLAARPDLLWIIDEAFIEYAGPEADVSILRRMPSNGVVLRSLTKFHALPGVRIGYLAASAELAEAVRADLPAWNVNVFALSAAVAALGDTSDFAERARAENAERRADLAAVLSGLPGVEVFPSSANYVLFRWRGAPKDLYGILLRRFGIAVRDCSNYCGLDDGTWFRAAVRFPEEHHRLAGALREVMEEGDVPKKSAADTPLLAYGRMKNREKDEGDLSLKKISPSPADFPISGSSSVFPAGRSSRRTPALMLQGTSSNAGKSILAAAYCRIFRQDGYNVAPFKAQNMSLNSGVTANGDEMSWAQIVAQAARADPDARMNPILLKPHSDTGSQVVILGQPLGHMDVLEYFGKKRELWSAVTDSYDSLAAECDIVVLEGAGSPGEINLKSHDLVNMRMADYARASVLLVGDIDRGGLYASFLGTWMSFTDAERRLLTGYIVNRFRGDASL
ncbi:MAG: cobyric acid synthase, partial [Bilophila wadsworthia]